MKMYMNAETGSVATREEWIYEDETGRHDPVEEGTVTEVRWNKAEERWTEATNGWQYCENHEYTTGHSPLFNRTVCFTCDPESPNNQHRPEAQAEIKRELENHPVYFFDEEGYIIPFKATKFDTVYTCPHCKSEIRWYKTGDTTKWACECPPAAVLGRKGGKVKSPRKTLAVRENGKKGGYPKGRPRKKAIA